jgi:hypothetical protein
LIYQWRFEGVDIAGAISSTLQIPGVDTNDQGTYTCLVANTSGAVLSLPAPLAVPGQAKWLWISRPGGSKDDAILGLSLVGANLWGAGLNGGHRFQRFSTLTAAAGSSVLVSSRGDGVNAVAQDALGTVYAGMDDPLTPGKPALFTRYRSARLSRTQLATERGSRFSTDSNADTLAVTVDDDSRPIAGGEFQGFGKFGTVSFGSQSLGGMRGFVSAFDALGAQRWVREVYSDTDAGGSGIWGLAVNAADAVFACGSVGPSGRVLRSSTPSDLATLATTKAACPLALKYDSEGTLVWAASWDVDGHLFSCVTDADGDLWVTGYEGSRTDAALQTAVLKELSGIDGSVLQELRLPFAEGCSLALHPERGVAWLLLDAQGLLDVADRRFGVPGYRVLGLNSSNLTSRWDLPVFGFPTLSSESEKADIIFTPDGRLITGLTFQQQDQPSTVVDFSGQASYSMKSRLTDGFVAIIGEQPLIKTPPTHQFVARGGTATFTVEHEGDLLPKFQWFKSTTALSGKTTNQLELTNVQTSTAGSYVVRLSNGRDNLSSPAGKLSVVDQTAKTVTLKARAQLTLTISTGGEGLTYQWFKGTTQINNVTGRISGATGKSLVIKAMTVDDAGSYVCKVTNSLTSTSLDGGVNTVVVTP